MIRTRTLPTLTYHPNFVWTHDTVDIKESEPQPIAPTFQDGLHDIDILMVPCFDEHGQLSHIDFYDKSTVVYTHKFDCTPFCEPSTEQILLVSAGGKWCSIGDLSQMEQIFKCSKTKQVVTRSQCLSQSDTTFSFANSAALDILSPQQAIEAGAITIDGMQSFWCMRKTKDSMFITIKLRMS